jgi:hypothetical protein
MSQRVAMTYLIKSNHMPRSRRVYHSVARSYEKLMSRWG